MSEYDTTHLLVVFAVLVLNGVVVGVATWLGLPGSSSTPNPWVFGACVATGITVIAVGRRHLKQRGDGDP